jgi:hypothetical protein
VSKTDSNLYELVRRHSQRGDMIFVLAGSTIPWVLRPSPDHGAAQYQLIRPSYMHGIMDGEAIVAAAKEKGYGDDELDRVFEEIYLVVI